jgi:hypothetical protein
LYAQASKSSAISKLEGVLAIGPNDRAKQVACSLRMASCVTSLSSSSLLLLLLLCLMSQSFQQGATEDQVNPKTRDSARAVAGKPAGAIDPTAPLAGTGAHTRRRRCDPTPSRVCAHRCTETSSAQHDRARHVSARIRLWPRTCCRRIQCWHGSNSGGSSGGTDDADAGQRERGDGAAHDARAAHVSRAA